MPLLLLAWTLILAFLTAHMEINIEGKYGWAQKLPTWRVSNRFTSAILSGSPLTGYHFWFFFAFFTLFHVSLFLGIPWTPVLEIQILMAFFIFLLCEDFLWFLINPAYGIKRFREKYVPWHKQWFLGVPIGYYKALITISCLYYISVLLRHY